MISESAMWQSEIEEIEEESEVSNERLHFLQPNKYVPSLSGSVHVPVLRRFNPAAKNRFNQRQGGS
jgi:hypothetical protein